MTAEDLTPLRIANLRFTPTDEATSKTGRLGDIELDVPPFHLHLQLRRSSSGRIYLSFNSFRRVDRKGREHFALRPMNDDARLALEIAVFTALRIRPTESAP